MWIDQEVAFLFTKALKSVTGALNYRWNLYYLLPHHHLTRYSSHHRQDRWIPLIPRVSGSWQASSFLLSVVSRSSWSLSVFIESDVSYIISFLPLASAARPAPSQRTHSTEIGLPIGTGSDRKSRVHSAFPYNFYRSGRMPRSWACLPAIAVPSAA